jgi:hypothetical protein
MEYFYQVQEVQLSKILEHLQKQKNFCFFDWRIDNSLGISLILRVTLLSFSHCVPFAWGTEMQLAALHA